MIKNLLKAKMSSSGWKKLSRIKANFLACFSRKDLTALAQIYSSDKWGQHYYTPHYQTHLSAYRESAKHILEVGIGGYNNPEEGGASLRMWRAYFKKAVVHGLDIHDKSPHAEKRIQIHTGSQVDEKVLHEVVKSAGGELDIIIDDGSHMNEHVITTFSLLFPKLKEGGMYIVEDTQTSYWTRYGGASRGDQNAMTMMNFFKQLIDGLNYEEFREEDYQPTYYDKSITAIHFYHNLVFIKKGNNVEGSNILG